MRNAPRAPSLRTKGSRPPAEFILTRTWSPPAFATADITSWTGMLTGSISVRGLSSGLKISYRTAGAEDEVRKDV